MNILVLNGSPKVKSDTMHITKAFIKGMEEDSSNNIEIINVINRHIKPCIGCLKCWQNKNNQCVQQDDMNEILLKFIKADLVIWSFPLYSYSMPSHLKAVLDRLLPLSKSEMKAENGRVVHPSVKNRKDRYTVVISGCGFPDWKGNFDALRIMCSNCFRKNLTAVFVPESPMFNSPEAVSVTEPLLEKFEQAGKEYLENKRLSEETIQALETPMIPAEIYLKICNGEM